MTRTSPLCFLVCFVLLSLVPTALSAPFLNSLSPLAGPINTNITISGSNFQQTKYLACSFNGFLVPAVFQTPYAVSCLLTFGSPTATNFTVTVTTDRKTFSNSLGFFYLTVPQVSYGSPLQGPDTGNTSVTFYNYGSGSSAIRPENPIYCRFDNETVVQAVSYFSDWSFTCITPPHSPGNVPITFSYDGLNFGNYSVNFTYISSSMPTVFSITPSAGPTWANVTVNGMAFKNTPQLMCRFGRFIVPASYFQSSTSISCPIPHGLSYGSFNLSVSNDGREWSSTNANFTLLEEPQISYASPYNISTSVNGGAAITFYNYGPGSSWVQPPMYCLFDTTVVEASQYFADWSFVCVAPPHSPGNFTIQVSYDGHHWTWQQWNISYVDGSEVTSITPLSGPRNARLTIQGFGFRNKSEVYCVFGPVFDFIQTPATIISSNQVSCRVNSTLPYGPAAVTLLVDGQYSRSNFIFNVTGAPTVSYITPSQWSVKGNGTLQMYSYGPGSAAMSPDAPVFCKFGTTIVQATNYFEDWITYCPIPKRSRAGTVAFSASYDKVTWSTQPVNFTYVSTTYLNMVMLDD